MINRYTMIPFIRHGVTYTRYGADEELSETGEWCKYEDIQVELEQLRTTIHNLESRIP